MLRLAPGQIWFTETGAIISRRKPSAKTPFDRRKLIRTGAHRAAAATKRVFTLAATSARISRVYIYHWRAGGAHGLGLGAAVGERDAATVVRRLRTAGAARRW